MRFLSLCIQKRLRAVNELFEGKAYVCNNPKGTVSLFSEVGILQELAKG